MAAGIIKRIGSKSEAVAAAPRMGIRTLVVAVLLVISVRKVTSSAIPSRRARRGRLSMPEKTLAMVVLKPDCLKPSPRQRPAPTSTNIPQGICLAVFQSKSRSPFFSPLGRQKRKITAMKATLASLALGRSSQVFHPPKGSERVIQARAVRPKTTKVRISGVRHVPGSGRVSDSFPVMPRLNQSQMTSTMLTLTGTPNFIHSVKDSSGCPKSL